MAGWSVALAILVAAFILIHVLALPKAFLRADFGRLPVTGRGVGSVESESCRSMVYEPDTAAGKYIKKYALSERDGKKYLTCRLDGSVKYLDFDVALFNKDGDAFKILNVKEIIEKQGFTKECELPAETAFITLSVNRANGEITGKGLRGGISPKNFALYLCFSAAADIVCAVFAKICVTNIFGGIYGESFLLSGIDWLYTFLAAFGIAAVNLSAAAIYILYKSGKLKGAGRDGKL